jgi:hypothetical protein
LISELDNGIKTPPLVVDDSPNSVRQQMYLSDQSLGLRCLALLSIPHPVTRSGRSALLNANPLHILRLSAVIIDSTLFCPSLWNPAGYFRITSPFNVQPSAPIIDKGE